MRDSCQHQMTTICPEVLDLAQRAGRNYPTWYAGRTVSPWCRICGKGRPRNDRKVRANRDAGPSARSLPACEG